MERTYYKYVDGKRVGRGIKARSKEEAVKQFMEEESHKGYEIAPRSQVARRAFKNSSIFDKSYWTG